MGYEFFFLLFLHYLGDFPLQGQFLAENKGKDDYLLFSHAMIWTGVICLGLMFFDILSMWKILFLLGGHFFIDRWKARKVDATYTEFMVDQMSHVVQLIIVYVF